MKRAFEEESFPRGGAAAPRAAPPPGDARAKKRAVALPRLDAKVSPWPWQEGCAGS